MLQKRYRRALMIALRRNHTADSWRTLAIACGRGKDTHTRAVKEYFKQKGLYDVAQRLFRRRKYRKKVLRNLLREFEQEFKSLVS